MKKTVNRPMSFAIVAIVYIAASIIAFEVFRRVSGLLWQRILIADVVATVFVFIFSVIFGNASMYDPYWSVQPVVILAPLALVSPSPAKLVLLCAVTIWAARLTANWAYTFHGLSSQDWRYSKLKKQTGKLYPFVNLAGIHMFPTLVVFLCVLPAISVMEENPAFRPLCLTGTAISVCAFVLQLVSDTQMHRYRKERKTPFMEEGLWKYSRHPNYLGEILMWWGVALYSVVLLGFRWYLILGAVVNNIMFLVISIPMADKRQSEKPGYSEYRKGKHSLLPLKPLR